MLHQLIGAAFRAMSRWCTPARFGTIDTFPSKAAAADASEDNPTYEMATVRRFIIGKEPVSKFVENSRKMFLLKVTRLNFIPNTQHLLSPKIDESL